MVFTQTVGGGPLVGRLARAVALLVAVLLPLGIGNAASPDNEPPYVAEMPYFNGFERQPDDSFEGESGRGSDWDENGLWNVRQGIGTWRSRSGRQYLDSNPLSLPTGLLGLEVGAELKYPIRIAPEAREPILTFWYQLSLHQPGDVFLVQVRVHGTGDWITLAEFDRSRATSGKYRQAVIDLKPFTGHTVWLRFGQRFTRLSLLQVRRWAVDDLLIFDSYEDGEEPIEAPGPVQGLAASVEAPEVRLTWAAPVGGAAVEGYLVDRVRLDGTAERLTPVPQTATEYVDTTAANGTGYHYRVTPVGAEGVLGEPAEFGVFVAYNDAAVQGFTVVREGWDARLSWEASSGLRYRLFRGVEADSTAPLGEVHGASYLDSRPGWSETVHYRIATLREFEDPFSGEVFALQGPLSAAVSLAPLPPLTVDVDALRVGERFELLWEGERFQSLGGSYANAVGPVLVSAHGRAGHVRSEASDGSFRLAVPVAGPVALELTVSELEEPARMATVTVWLVADTAAPLVQFDGAAERESSEDVILLDGVAVDHQSGLASLTISSDRHPGVSFQPFLDNGRFSVEVPLAHGANRVTATAVDRAGNSASAQVSVNRQISAAPRLAILSPSAGTVVRTETVTVSGVVYSSLPSTQLRVSSGNALVFPEPGAQEGLHVFALPDVPLQLGNNQIAVTVESPQGADRQVVTVLRDDSGEAEVSPPALEITSPLAGSSFTNRDTVVVAGSAVSAVGIANITVNGVAVAVGGQDSKSLSFRHSVDVGAEGVEIVVSAADIDGRTSGRTISLWRDSLPPQIVLHDSGLAPAPAVNAIVEAPFRLRGSVSDANLAGASINGQPLGLAPGESEGQYRFDTLLALTVGDPVSLHLSAWDHAGNRSELEYLLQFAPMVGIDILAPPSGAVLDVAGDTASVEVIARLQGLADGHTVRLQHTGGAARPLAVADMLARTVLELPADSAEHEVVIEVLEAGAVVASARRRFRVVNADELPLAVARTDPANGAGNVEPNRPIRVFFNRAIDPSRLAVQISETAHGPTYDLSANQGRSALETGGTLPIIQVNRDQAPVAGSVAVLPDHRSVVFYPGREFAYGGEVYVDVRYDGESLARFNYGIRPLPSFLAGLVIDQYGLPVADVEVALPTQNLRTRTDRNGAFDFGFRASAAATLAPGRQQLVINPGLADRRFGTSSQWITVELGRLNRTPDVRVPRLNPELPFEPIRSRDANVSLARDELRLDLSEARLLFDNGRDYGDVHVQPLSREEVPHRAQPIANPHWLFAMQPGVRVEGRVGLSLAMPPLYGSYEYVPEEGTLVIMVGYHPDEMRLIPVGIGQIAQRRVQSVEKLALPALDYLGYVLVPDALQPWLQRYRAGAISFEALIAELER